jgi:hypothetical protein
VYHLRLAASQIQYRNGREGRKELKKQSKLFFAHFAAFAVK